MYESTATCILHYNLSPIFFKSKYFFHIPSFEQDGGVQGGLDGSWCARTPEVLQPGFSLAIHVLVWLLYESHLQVYCDCIRMYWCVCKRVSSVYITHEKQENITILTEVKLPHKAVEVAVLEVKWQNFFRKGGVV